MGPLSFGTAAAAVVGTAMLNMSLIVVAQAAAAETTLRLNNPSWGVSPSSGRVLTRPPGAVISVI